MMTFFARLPLFFFLGLLSFLTVAVGAQGQEVSAAPNPQKIPSLEALEESLLTVLNRERAAQNLGRLRLSKELSSLARIQSREMAGLGILMHASADGKSYTERLTEANVLFRANGENVARSETFVPELIHESFMESPGHRKNILHPDFDTVGIGIVQGEDRAYYITEDFIQSFVKREDEEVRDTLLSRMNVFRRENTLPPLALVEVVNQAAKAYARSRARGSLPDAVPEEFSGGRMAFVSGPDLDAITAALRKHLLEEYTRGGIGVWFDRNADYPGGAYFVCAVLFPGDRFKGVSPAARAAAVLDALNEIRGTKGLEALGLDETLEKAAEEILSGLRRRTQRNLDAPLGTSAWIYETPDLEILPEGLKKEIQDSYYRKVGISVLALEGEGQLRQQYAVVVLLYQ